MSLDTVERGVLYDRTPVSNPLMQRVMVLKTERRRIDAELRELKERMRVGICERCGKSFVRARYTKRYCSQKCTIQAAPCNSMSYSLDLITEHIDALEACAVMTPRSIEVLRILVDKRRTHAVADLITISHQRVSQIAAKATKAIHLMLRMRDAMRPAEVTHV